MQYFSNSISLDELDFFLNTVAEEHTPPLNSVVNIAEYAKKIKDNGDTFEARDGNDLCGIIAGYFNDPSLQCCFITFLHVKKNLQRGGIGTALMRNAILFAQEKNFHHMDLMVNKTNVKAINFYKKLGFSAIEEVDIQYKMRKFLN